MILRAKGKYIDTLPMADLLSQEEKLMDWIVFEVDRIYEGFDLADYTFVIRGVTASGGETQAELLPEVLTDTLRLPWQVGKDFTAEGGTLALDLFAYWYADPASDPAVTAPTRILRYQLPPVHVRPLPACDHVLDSQSYTAFLAEVKETAEQGITEMTTISTDFAAAAEDFAQRLTALESSVHALKQQLDAMTPVTVLTESEYAALDAPAEDVLYVVREDA